MVEWPAPIEVGEVRYFHGLASFYKKFIKNFSTICAPMMKTMRIDKKEFKWTF